ncbi:MAG: inositol-3-phosphate synthase [Desulfatiglandales bacterium]
MEKIRIAIVGVGNCASALIQGINYYRRRDPKDAIGLMHWQIGPYTPDSIEVVLAFDIDKRKVNRPLSEAIFAKPNCTKVFCDKIEGTDPKVLMGRILDGYSSHMEEYHEDSRFVLADHPEPDFKGVVNAIKKAKVDMLLNYLPVGAEEATKFYAECALEAGAGFINNIPVFIASNPEWANRFKEKGLPVIGDDIKSQIGATITHRVLVDLFKKRGVKLDRTYQLNFGGNTDFLNMLNRSRLRSKKISKTEAVQSVAASKLEGEDIHIGPSDYVPWQRDNKICYLRMEGRIFGDVEINLELRLSVEDSPNSAGIVIDAIRCAKIAMDRGISGVLYSPSAYFMKHPPKQYPDDEAYRMIEEFISGKRAN